MIVFVKYKLLNEFKYLRACTYVWKTDNWKTAFSFARKLDELKLFFPELEQLPDPNVVSNKIIVSNELLRLVRLGLGFGSGFILYAWNYNPNKLLELLNVLTNNFIGYIVRIGWNSAK